MLRRIRIKSLEDIALGLIQRDNETKKDYYNYHDTVKELGFEIKSDIIPNLTKKQEFSLITDIKKESKSQKKSTKNMKPPKPVNNKNKISNNLSGVQKIPNKKFSVGKKICKDINSDLKNDGTEINLKDKNNEENYMFKKTKKLLYNDKLFFPLDENNINIIIGNCYFPLLQIFQSYDNLKSMLFDITDKLEVYFNNDSFFTLNQACSKELEEFIDEEKILELIEFCIIIFLLQYFIKGNNNILSNNSTTKDNTDDNNNISNTEEDITKIFQECYSVLQKIYENLILKLLFNENYNKSQKNENKNEIFEKYISEFFIFMQKPKNNEQIINKINENISLIIKGLFKSIKLILEYIKLSGIKFDENFKEDPQLINIEINETEGVFSDSIKNLDNINELNTIVNLCNFYIDQKSDIFQKFMEKVKLDQYKCFKTINAYFNLIIAKSKIKPNKNSPKKKIPDTTTNKKPLVISPSLYKKIQISVYIYYDNFKILLEKNKIKVPFLPPMDTNKYKYTLVLDLDETLVHYIEEKDRHYVQVRPFAEFFISEMGKYFELVIFTSAEEEYANIVLEEIDKNKVITHKLYRRHVEYNNGLCLKDLDKIGRDVKKVCIIDNDKNNFKLHEDNGIEIKEFLGEQDDNELDLLGDLLMSIIESNSDDIRPIIKDIKNKMNKINEEKNNIEK